ncbi:MAG: tyrosine-type recombinase/integrase [Fimbriimonadaceae bacterium]|nr:tyrosine-type recombinase/integrase [Fimbriimonadaceae bacterium]
MKQAIFGVARVQEVARGDGRVNYTIFDSEGRLDSLCDGFLRTCAGGTDRTYAYLLVDHLRWLESERLARESATFRDLTRYMGAIGADYRGPMGSPWRSATKPYQESTLQTSAACLKRFYLFLATKGINRALADELKQDRLPTKVDRNRMLLGHLAESLPVNPLSPRRATRIRHPKLPPEEARTKLLAVVTSARDAMAVTWLADAGFRIGELCGLHLVDLHLREGAQCGQCRAPHVHICHRDGNPNRARVKTKNSWSFEGGVVSGGGIRRVSPAMIHSYFEYITTEYPADVRHGMLFVQLQGPAAGEPWAPAAARGMLARASRRAGLRTVRPHSFRHQFATNVLEASGGNTVLAREAGGWAAAETVERVYGHLDVDNPEFAAALDRVWTKR